MTLFHRFCHLIPLFLLVLTLGACAGGTNDFKPWGEAQTTGDASASAPAALPPTLNGVTKVAILLPLSGTHASVGQSMLQAAQLALFDVGGDSLELISKDTGGTAQGAHTAAQAAVNEGAQIILGPLLADEVRAVKSVTAPRGLNVMAFSTDWTLAGGNVYIMGFTPFSQVNRIAGYAAVKGLRNVAVASPADTYGLAVSSAFEKEAANNGLRISRVLSDVNAYDSVFIPAGGQTLTQSLARVSNKNAQKLGTGLWDDPRIAADPAMEGALFAAPSPSARARFEQRYQSTYGTAPVRIASLAYDATALAAALAPQGYTPAALQNRSGFAGVDGIMRFQPSGLMERGMAILQIKGGRITEIDPAPHSF